MIGTEHAAPEGAEHDAGVVDDDADVPAGGNPRRNVGDELVEPAGRNLGRRDTRGTRAAIRISL
jgi:hypothetical protein